MRLLCCSVLLSFGLCSSFAATAPTKETPHLQFVQEYERGLSSMREIHSSCQSEMAPTEYSSVFENAIHCSTALQLERRLQIRRLNQMHLGGQFKTLIPFLTSTYQSQIELYQRLIIISTAMLSEPKPGVDYGKLAAEVPEIQAKLEFLDKAIFEVVPLVAATLIDPKPDSKNYVNHLLISQAEKASLVSDIDRDFGKWMYEKNPDYSSAAAKILKTFLEEKGFKCSDEPWE